MVGDFLRVRFPEPWLTLSSTSYASLLDECVAARISGGGVYDALVGACARESGAKLWSRDRRAGLVYRALGIEFELIG